MSSYARDKINPKNSSDAELSKYFRIDWIFVLKAVSQQYILTIRIDPMISCMVFTRLSVIFRVRALKWKTIQKRNN